jgi:hypothetical protein
MSHVTFSNKNSVRIIEKWGLEHHLARKSEWLFMVRDRIEFERRIKKFDRILSPFLTDGHRKKIYLQKILTERCLVIDIQAFCVPKFSPKEISITDGKRFSHHVFKPPLPFQELSKSCVNQIRYLETFHHTIRYNAGHIKFEEINNILQQFTKGVNYVFVKGHQKKNFLDEHLQCEIINLETFPGVPNLDKCAESCLYHRESNSFCSIHNVKKLCKFLNL